MFGVAFFWAAVFGTTFGAAAFFRVDRREVGPDAKWHVQARLWLERLEWLTYDWRARELGELSSRSDEVVMVTVDHETISNARETDRVEWSMRPWPRELIGRLVDQLIREGAALVVVDQPFRDVSPRTCPPRRGEHARTDDERFADVLMAHDERAILTFSFSGQRTRPAERPLMTVMVRLGEYASIRDANDVIREALGRKAPVTFLLSGGNPVLWAAAANDAAARELAAALGIKNPVFRPRVPSDEDHEVSEAWLAQRLSEVEVAGLDVEGVVEARSIEAPVAPLLRWSFPPGASSFLPDPDSKIRAVPLLVRGEREGAPVLLASAPLLAVMTLLKTKDLVYREGRLHVGRRFEVPMEPDGFLALAWDTSEPGRGGRGTVKRSIPAWRLLQNAEDDADGKGGRHYDNDLAGRVVVLTEERSSEAPMVSTPVGALEHGAVMAQAIVNLMHSKGVVRASPLGDFWLTVAFAFVGAVLAVLWSTMARNPGWLAWVLTIGVVSGLHALVARQVFIAELRWVAMASPLLACGLTFLAALGYARTLERGFREFIGRALGGAVKADVFARVERDLALMQPERRVLTVYFSDIEGFTAVAQERDPGQVVAALRSHLNETTSVVIDSGGHVDKYLGDGLMAFWGAPVSLGDQMTVACEAALTMQERFEKRRPELERQLGRALIMRAGIEAGPTVVGEMGTMHRVNYTVMGEPVATAFRLEAIAKRYGSRILVSRSVVEGALHSHVFRSVDRVRLGRATAPIDVFELMGRVTDRSGLAQRVERHERAVVAFRERRFADALELFEAALSLDPHDPLISRYVSRCWSYLSQPPPDEWDGVCDRDEAIAAVNPSAPRLPPRSA
jgi:adenylate cyclase